MKPVQKGLCCLIAFFCFSVLAASQVSPNLENGWKPFGSYDGSHLDTVNLMNGNLMLHLPLVPDVPQRGAVPLGDVLFTTSKDWQVVCATLPSGLMGCSWKHGATQFQVQPTVGVSVQRSIDTVFVIGNLEAQSAFNYVLVTNDGASHQLQGVAGSQDANGVPTKYDTFDLTGYHLELSNSDANGVPGNFTVIDRHGVQYQSDLFHQAYCGKFPSTNRLPQSGEYASMIDDSSNGGQTCQQFAYANLVTDSNGNQINLTPYQQSSAMRDTLGRVGQLYLSGPAFDGNDSTGCVNSHPFQSSVVLYYVDPNGVTQPVKECFSTINLHTAFSQTSPYGGLVGEYNSTVSGAAGLLTTVILADGTKWTFDYDSYGKLTYVGLPTGGSITYTWTTINFANCDLVNPTTVSRAVATRTLNDGQGHTQQWSYVWGTATGSGLTNVVTDPLGNDTVHIFTQQAPAGGNPPPGCFLYETSTIDYQGSQSANHPLQRVDTTYTSGAFADASGAPAVGNVFATDILTTVYPSGKVKKVHRDPDTGLGAGQPIFGNVKKELEYDWGQGAPGALLRETDTTYQWETNSSYLTAHLLDLPASVVVKDGGGNPVAETDYTYDEPSYLTTPTPGITTQHVAPPYGVRGNQTTVSRWLNTTGGSVVSHTNWYDTGEVYQQIDPLGHTTTHTYDPAYVGAYATETCSQATSGGSVSHCVSGTYDFNTGVLTSLTNENASTQASGNSFGDSAHTSNYGYDLMFRLTSAQAPPDPANGNLRAQNTFTFSLPNTFPVTAQRTRSVTSTLSDTATSSYDGLGRVFKTQHTLPNGTATVDTTFDLGGHVATVSNPYFTTSDATYGIITNQYDGLDRVTQTTKQDGSISRVQYNVATTIAVNGNCTISTDEAGKARGACTDALNRLVEVDEPNPAGVTIQANYHATLDTTGNFVLANSSNTSLWWTGTGGTNAQSIFMQDDGNLVVYVMRWLAGTYAAPTPGSYPQAACSIGTYLVAGQTLPSGSCIASPHWQYFLYMAPDGNLYIYNWATGAGTWGPGTQGHPGAYATLQTDGNFVVYTSTGVALWSSGTSGTNAERLDMEDDGRIILYKSAWNSGTSTGQFNYTALAHPACDAGIGTGTTGVLGSGQCFVSPNGHFELLLQADGNLVINDLGASPTNALWSTSTGISPADPGYALRTFYKYDTLGNLYCVEQHGDAASGTACPASPPGPTDLPVPPDPNNAWRRRLFAYDSLSRLRWASNPESGIITYTYDNDGNLLQKTSPAPNPNPPQPTQTISYCYDELHRITGKAYGALNCPLTSPVVSYVYDSGANAKGHLTQMTDQAGTASYSYDILGRMTTETRTLTGANNGAISKTLSYEYNLDGSLYKLHYPSNAVVTYTPDSAGRIAQAVDGGNGINYVTGATYGPDSSLTGFVSGSGGTAPVTNLFSYNNRLQLCRMTASTGTLPNNCLDTTNHGNIFDIGYDFHKGNGNNGNVFGITNYKDSNRTQTFTYDPLNRLLSAQNAGTNCAATTVNGKTEYWGNSYAYDAWGNLLGKTVTKCGAENLGVTVDAHNWIHHSPTDYQYDAAGNMTFDATENVGLSYDQENRIIGAAGYTYTYDGDGNRVRKSNGNLAGNGTLYWYMTPGVVAETDLAGTTKSEYIFFDGERVARRDGVNSTGGVFYYFSDHLKTASVITDSAGTIKAESDYYPWGGELRFVNNDSNDYKFTGKKRDAETGLDYFGARYYSNGLGRWVSADWSATPVPVPYANLSDPQSMNLYSYVRGLPTTKADIDGHGWWKKFLNRMGDAGCWCEGKEAEKAKQDRKAAYEAYEQAMQVVVHDPKNQQIIAMAQLVAVSDFYDAFLGGYGESAVGDVAEETTTTQTSAAEQLQGAANRASTTVGPGRGGVHGTAVHKTFEGEVKALGNSNLSTEVSYKDGVEVRRGTAGSIRVDAVEGPKQAPTNVYDLKTGDAKLTPVRTQQIQSHVPGGTKVPVTEIKPQP